MRKSTLPLLCAVLPLLWSCGPRNTELIKVVDWSVDESSSWEGRTREELVADLGRPTDIESDGKGGEVYSYYEFELLGGFPGLPAPPHLAPDMDGIPTDQPVRTGGSDEGPWVETKVLAKFWIEENGIVYEQWVEPGLRFKRRTQFVKPRPVH